MPSRPGNRSPSAGDLGDFLDLPGGNRPTTLPGTINRPGTGNRPQRPGTGGDRPGIVDRPNRPGDGNRPGAGNRPGRPGNRPGIGNGNINIDIDKENNINSIRNHWNNVDRRPFDRDWWQNRPVNLPGYVPGRPGYPGWRWHGSWNNYPSGWCWRAASWAAVGSWFTWTVAQPVPYNYGTNVVYQDNSVYVNDQPVATSEVYYEQADTIAESIPEDVDPKQVEWMPLGVFAVADENATDSGMLMQLAVSKEGIIAGTFYSETTDSSRPLEGTVDRTTQRAAWKFADDKNTDVVMETGVYNLTQDEATALVHFGADQHQNWLMVRLPPEEEAQTTNE